LRLAVYWTLIGWTLYGGISLGYWILRQDWLDRLYPAPEEWNSMVKYLWRQAKHEQITEGHGRGIVDWSLVGSHMKAAVQNLEDFWFIWHYPTGVLEQTDWDRSIPGIDPEDIVKPLERYSKKHKKTEVLQKIGCDISMKSEGWIRGYFEASMLVAKAAERQDGYVVDATRSIVFAANTMIGPSNPYPKPILPGGPPAPLEENCQPAAEAPEYYYTRILTTKGFTHGQRMQAGLAYAQWLDYRSQPDLAKAMLHWSLTLALSHLPNASSILDPTTGVILATAPFVTPNILAATTALASHHARHDDIPAALQIYTSVLRARRAAPDAPAAQQYKPVPPDYSLRSLDSVARWLSSLPFPAAFPPAPPSGDEPFARTRTAECDEAALMAYVGEILFARGRRRAQGLAWTREATGVAERRLEDQRLDAESRTACAQCVGTGLANWLAMVKQLADEEKEGGKGLVQTDLGSGGGGGGGSGWRRWVPFLASGDNEQTHAEEADWALEAETVHRKLAAFSQAQLDKRLRAAISGTSSWFVA